MDRVYFSRTFEESAEALWALVEDFGDYRWGEGVGEARIEGGESANTPGAIRNFLYYGSASRQRLTEHRPGDRSMTWESVEPFDDSLAYYRATLRIAPIMAGGGAFAEWSADFDARADAVARWHDLQFTEFGKSLDRLERLAKGIQTS